MVRVCSACHSPEIVLGQQLTEQGWQDVVATMADYGAAASDTELKEITAYLVRNFPATPES